MQLANLSREADFHIDKDPPVTRRPIPHTLSSRAAARPFNRQPLMLAGRDPTAARLKAVVGRARGKSAMHPLHRAPASQLSMPRLSALCDAVEERATGTLNTLMGGVIAGIAVWVGGSVAMTLIASAL